MFDPQLLQQAGQRLASLKRELTLTLDPGPDPQGAFSSAMSEILDGLSAASGARLQVLRKQSAKYPGRTSFCVGNIHYLAIPWGPELEPFVELLELLATDPPAGDEQPPLEPATVEVLMAPTCPHCPRVVEVCTRVAARRPQIHLAVIDVQQFEDLSYSVKSVPATVVDTTHTSIGLLDEGQLMQVLAGRGSPEHFARTMESLLEAGRMDEAAEMLSCEDGHTALASLMEGGGFQERLGLMMLAEEALEQDPHRLDGALPTLIPLLASDNPSLRGDTADLLGKIGAPGARDALTGLLSDPNEDVQEIVQDALEMLRKPS